jgi:predicted TIM-barrel fold metal-dependent hydrolase
MSALRIVDAHHHLWDLERIYYPWLSDRVRAVVFGDYSAIRRNYLVGDFIADIGALNVVKSVHIQADCDPPLALEETRWLQSVADGPGSRGLPHAIVAHVDLSKPDAAGELDRHMRSPNMRGIRQMLHHSRTADPTVSAVEYLDDPTWLANLDLLTQRRLSFDIQLFPEQMSRAARVIEENPGLQFILCHAGSPRRRDADGIRVWREGMRKLARQDNVAVKISGLGMYDLQWTSKSIRPFVEETITVFGPGRCMFASNFPVDALMSRYEAVWNAFDDITLPLDSRAREGLFAANAEKFYRI